MLPFIIMDEKKDFEQHTQSDVSDNPFIYKLRSVVDINLQNEQFGVKELAKSLHMSRSTLHRKLQQATGQSISQFIREYRLEKAHQALKKHEFSISEVAHKVGFGSSSYFSKSFAEVYGYPPVEVKKRLHQPRPLKLQKKGAIQGRKRKIYFSGLVLILITLFFFISNTNTSREDISTISGESVGIAVLPFKNSSEDNSNQYFADGVMNAVLNKLAKVSDIRVIGRASVEQFRETIKSIPEIGRELNVDYILEGSAQKYGEEIKITVQLNSVTSNAQIWSREYSRKFEDILYLQGEIAESLVIELKSSLSSQEKIALTSAPTENIEAYNKYLMAEYLFFRFTAESMAEAITLYEQCIALSPTFVNAYAHLAEIYVLSGAESGTMSQELAWNKARELLAICLELDPENPYALDVLGGGYYVFEWDFQKANEYFELNKQMTGIKGDCFALDFLVKMGSPQTTLDIVEKLIATDPLASWNYFFKAEALYLLGRREEALNTLDKANRRFDDFLLKRECVKWYYLMGSKDKFMAAHQKLIKSFPDRPPLVLWLEVAYAITEGNDPMEYLGALAEMYEQDLSGSPAWYMALSQAAIGNETGVFEWLEKSYVRRETEMTWLKMEPALDPYKNDPRYISLMERLNFPDTWGH